jgi:hypothetical protein
VAAAGISHARSVDGGSPVGVAAGSTVKANVPRARCPARSTTCNADGVVAGASSGSGCTTTGPVDHRAGGRATRRPVSRRVGHGDVDAAGYQVPRRT